MNNPYEQEIRYRLLKILSEDSTLTQREMSRRMGISLGKVNFCLSELAKKGLTEINRFKGSRNKRRYIYLLTPGGLEDKGRLSVRFLRRKVREYEEIKRQIRSLAEEVDGGVLEDISSESLLEVLKGSSRSSVQVRNFDKKGAILMGYSRSCGVTEGAEL